MPVPAVSEETAKCLFTRCMVVSQARADLLSADFDDEVGNAPDRYPPNMPPWWVSGVFDRGLVEGIVKYGWGAWRDMAEDPAFPFLVSRLEWNEQRKRADKVPGAVVPFCVFGLVCECLICDRGCSPMRSFLMLMAASFAIVVVFVLSFGLLFFFFFPGTHPPTFLLSPPLRPSLSTLVSRRCASGTCHASGLRRSASSLCTRSWRRSPARRGRCSRQLPSRQHRG